MTRTATAPATPGFPAASGRSDRVTVMRGSGACRTPNPRSAARARNRARVSSVNTCIGIAIFAFSCLSTSIISGWFNVNEPSTGTSTISIVPISARSRLGQRMVQMAEMRDAQIREVEHEDRVAVVAGLAETAHIGRDVVHPDIAVLQIVVRHPAARVPAAQYEFDAGLDIVGVMRRMRVVHRHDVGRHLRPVDAVIVGDDAHPLGAFDQKAGMAEIGQRRRLLPRRRTPQPCPVLGHDPGTSRPGRQRYQPNRMRDRRASGTRILSFAKAAFGHTAMVCRNAAGGPLRSPSRMLSRDAVSIALQSCASASMYGRKCRLRLRFRTISTRRPNRFSISSANPR